MLLDADEVHRQRSLACPDCDRCLDTALRRRWRSWTCQPCPLFPVAGLFRSLAAAERRLHHAQERLEADAP